MASGERIQGGLVIALPRDEQTGLGSPARQSTHSLDDLLDPFVAL